jgi:hemerythrin superfamily protein
MNTAEHETTRPAGSYSGRSAEDIENDIERTRADLDRTLDALQSKLSPRERLHAASESARELGQRFASRAASAMTPDITTMIRIDHTHVLMLFRRFRPWTSNTRKRALATNACLALEVHAQLEEEIFYPALREVTGAGNDVLDKSVPEHDEMRTLINALRNLEVTDPGFDDTFRRLMRTVLHHVADEESTLLPQAEMLLVGRLSALGMQMTKRRIELLRPNIGEVTLTAARSFPVATAVLALGVIALGWLAVRPRSRSS